MRIRRISRRVLEYPSRNCLLYTSYMAVSMRAALAQVRAEQGPDAVILSSRRVEEGVEVIAAVDYDEALFADATVKRAPIAPPEPPEVPLLMPEPLPARPHTAVPAVAPALAARGAPRALAAASGGTVRGNPAPAAPVAPLSAAAVTAATAPTVAQALSLIHI